MIGAEIVDVEPGYCAIALVPRPEISQQHGYVHAGILATLVDSAGGYAGLITLVWLAPLAIRLRRDHRVIDFLVALVLVGALGAFRLPPIELTRDRH